MTTLRPGRGVTIRVEPDHEGAHSGRADSVGAEWGVRDPELEARIDRAWAERCAANPMLYDGPMLAYSGYDDGRGEIRARRERYRRLAVFPAVRTGVSQVGVTGVLTANDGERGPVVLLAQRSERTRCYGGMWELAPSGGIEPPEIEPPEGDPNAAGPVTLRQADVLRSLLDELETELGIGGGGGGNVAPAFDHAHAVAIVNDPFAPSVDVVVHLEWPGPPPQMPGPGGEGGRWEYTASRWVAVEGLAAFDAEHGERIIPPTRALLRALWPGVFGA